ncbi:MAG: hypothetical protein JW908_04615 [Anaerolineales bacterium]|nr:hypothetical protein [Anaerolineales bacterium]
MSKPEIRLFYDYSDYAENSVIIGFREISGLFSWYENKILMRKPGIIGIREEIYKEGRKAVNDLYLLIICTN